MTKGDAAIVMAYLTQLYPQWAATEAILEMVADMFAVPMLEVDDGKTIAREHATKHAWPNIPALSSAIAVVVNRRTSDLAIQRAKAANISRDPNRKSISEWKRWYCDTIEGQREWKALPPGVRRGLRIVWKEHPQ